MNTATQSTEPSTVRIDLETRLTPILVVDDVQDNRELLEELLHGEGYKEILQAGSGMDALSILEERQDIGLVLLDLMMPGMDGYEVCQRISGCERTAHIPIIVVTGGALRRDEALIKSFERGAMDFIPKPVNEVELFGRVKSALELFQERKRNREHTQALMESRQRFELAVNGANDGIWDINIAKSEAYYSAQWKAILGYEDHELPNLPDLLEKLIHPEDREYVSRALRDHHDQRTASYSTEHRLRTKSGDYKWVSSRGRATWDADGSVVRMAGSTTDITERKCLEAQLRQAQQMESIGRLAAGVAHDFNNLLTAILGHASFLKLRLPGDSPLHVSLESIQKASSQAADLCKQMLAYSGQGRFVVERLDLNSLVNETASLLRVSINKKIGLDLNMAPQALLAEVDTSQIRQVVMNLVLNAAEAIGEQSGMISVTTTLLHATEADLAGAVFAPTKKAGSYIQIQVADTGCGMTRETLEKIFEPFFTTKFTGRGLGLAAVLGIVKVHGGFLKVRSEPGQGTCFQVLVPAIEATSGLSIRAETGCESLWKGSGTILLVDDEEQVREINSLLLQELGFEVRSAEDGARGLEIFKAHADEVDMVILDLTMPELNGAEVFEEIRKLRPGAKVLLASGYSEEEAVRRFTVDGLVGFIQKPFLLNALSAKLKECLASPA